MDLKGIMLSEKKSISKDYVLYGSIYLTLSKCRNFRDAKHINRYQKKDPEITVQIQEVT